MAVPLVKTYKKRLTHKFINRRSQILPSKYNLLQNNNVLFPTFKFIISKKKMFQALSFPLTLFSEFFSSEIANVAEITMSHRQLF